MSNEDHAIAVQWITETADQIANRHAIAERTVRGWLASGKSHKDIAEHLAVMTDYGIDDVPLYAMAYALIEGRPIGDLEDVR